MIRVVIADDHPLVRAGACALIQKTADIEVVGEATDGLEAVEITDKLRPQVLVIDIGMPRLNGLEAATRIRELNLETKIIILSMHSQNMLVRQALMLGARGYLLKSSLTDELATAIRVVEQGETYLTPVVANIVINDYRTLTSQMPVAAGPLDILTTRERQLLQLIAEGRTNRDMAQIMDVSERTVEKHRANLMEKLEVNDIPSMVRIAIKYGIITIE